LAAPLAAALAALAWIAAAKTSFVSPLTAALGLGLLLAALELAPRAAPPKLTASLAGALLVSLAFVGHAAAVGGVAGGVRIAIMATHLLLAGLWLGGLPALARALPSAGAQTEPLLRAFGKMGIGAAFLLATTGMIAAAWVVSLAGGPPGPRYLVTFAVKLGLISLLIAVASVNRWALTPLSASDPARAVSLLRWTVGLEQLLALAVVATVALLGQLDPAF
jgi:putative copper resistance protein D